MKAFLGTLSLLCFCAIVLCFFAYATGRLPTPKTTQHTLVAAIPQQVGTQVRTVEKDLLCSPCVERMASILETMKQEWAAPDTERGAAHEKTLTPELSTPFAPEARGWAGLSLEQGELAKQFFDQYGTEEGLRRLRESDPDAARQFEQKRREPPAPSESGEEPSAR